MSSRTSTPTLAARARLLRGLSDPSRLRIVEALRAGPKTVSEICVTSGLSQPNASNHLACLLGCGLVERERIGRFAYYRLAGERIAALLDLAEDVAAGVARTSRCPVCGSKPC
ncbi:MAG: metalloregulator ArsR/SmtB family transcription factor [Longimicrobiales bacterium]